MPALCTCNCLGLGCATPPPRESSCHGINDPSVILGKRHGRSSDQGYAAAKSLAALAGKVRLAVAGKFPIIPKGYSGLVKQLLAE